MTTDAGAEDAGAQDAGAEDAGADSASTDRPVCSAKRCGAAATWALEWNNPKLHTPDRRKTWLACDEHRPSLSDFLDRRGFLRDVIPLPSDRPETGAGGR